MTTFPTFPEFKSLTIEDRDEIHRRLWAYQPETSELTFVNLVYLARILQFQVVDL